MAKKRGDKNNDYLNNLAYEITSGKNKEKIAKGKKPGELGAAIARAIELTQDKLDPPELRERLANNILSFVSKHLMAETNRCSEALAAMEQGIRHASLKYIDWWLAQSAMMRALLHESSDIWIKEKYELWKNAFDRSRKAGNASVLYIAANRITFGYSDQVKSICELVEIQKTVLEAMDSLQVDPESLTSFGNDLYDFWSAADYKRIYEKDLRAKHYLMEGAKILKLKKPDAKAIPAIMVLLLAGIDTYQGPSAKWAKMQVKKTKTAIPQDVKNLLSVYLE